MKLLLANEGDCRFFKFWFEDQICNGVNYQGEMFLEFHVFHPLRRDQAYELGSRLLERNLSVLIACSKARYVLAINLRGDWWTVANAEKSKFLAQGQG